MQCKECKGPDPDQEGPDRVGAATTCGGLTKLKDINDECIKSIYLYMYKKHVYNKRE